MPPSATKPGPYPQKSASPLPQPPFFAATRRATSASGSPRAGRFFSHSARSLWNCARRRALCQEHVGRGARDSGHARERGTRAERRGGRRGVAPRRAARALPRAGALAAPRVARRWRRPTSRASASRPRASSWPAADEPRRRRPSRPSRPCRPRPQGRTPSPPASPRRNLRPARRRPATSTAGDATCQN